MRPRLRAKSELSYFNSVTRINRKLFKIHHSHRVVSERNKQGFRNAGSSMTRDQCNRSLKIPLTIRATTRRRTECRGALLFGALILQEECIPCGSPSNFAHLFSKEEIKDERSQERCCVFYLFRSVDEPLHLPKALLTFAVVRQKHGDVALKNSPRRIPLEYE